MWPSTVVSPLNLKDSLNFKTRLAAHFMMWFDGGNKHLDIGYLSNDPAIVKTQLDYLQLRGVDLLIPDWYGTQSSQQSAWKVIKADLESRKMPFALCFDSGIVKWRPDKTISPADYMIQQVQYALTNYMTSPQWEKLPDGRFLALEFGWETIPPETMDIAKVTAAFPQIGFIFRNAGGWGKPHSAGAFAWTDTTDQIAYQKDFIAKAPGHAGQYYFGSFVKGFDDHNRRPGGDPTQSAWGGPARICSERNGQTFLDHVALYNAAAVKPHYIQLVTTNDHEEGTDLEWGINSGVVCGATTANGIVGFSPQGNLNTVDHAEIYVDDKLVASVRDLSKPLSFDLNSVKGLQAGAHTVQAVLVGKPLFQQKLSPILTLKAGYVWS